MDGWSVSCRILCTHTHIHTFAHSFTLMSEFKIVILWHVVGRFEETKEPRKK